jgi:hypothetical protein
MKMTSRKPSAAAALIGLVVVVVPAWLPSAGCTFHRIVVNEHVRMLDPSSLKVGETTWTEAIRELGVPVSANTPQKLLRVELNQRSLRYTSAESRAVRLGIPLMYAVLPLRWSDTQNTLELLLEFDEDQRLTGVYETYEETIWPPFTSEPKRKPPVTRTILGGGPS